jgi:hypothetical protein
MMFGDEFLVPPSTSDIIIILMHKLHHSWQCADHGTKLNEVNAASETYLMLTLEQWQVS